MDMSGTALCSLYPLPPNLNVTPPSPHPSQFSHLRLSSLRGDWLTVPNLGMVAPDSCCISFSEGCGESGPQSKFYQEVSPTLSTPLHMQGQQGMLDSVATTTSAGGHPHFPSPPLPSANVLFQRFNVFMSCVSPPLVPHVVTHIIWLL